MLLRGNFMSPHKISPIGGIYVPHKISPMLLRGNFISPNHCSLAGRGRSQATQSAVWSGNETRGGWNGSLETRPHPPEIPLSNSHQHYISQEATFKWGKPAPRLQTQTLVGYKVQGTRYKVSGLSNNQYGPEDSLVLFSYN